MELRAYMYMHGGNILCMCSTCTYTSDLLATLHPRLALQIHTFAQSCTQGCPWRVCGIWCMVVGESSDLVRSGGDLAIVKSWMPLSCYAIQLAWVNWVLGTRTVGHVYMLLGSTASANATNTPYMYIALCSVPLMEWSPLHAPLC